MKTSIKTIVREYDNEGRLTKETETTTEYEYPNEIYPIYPSQPTQPWYVPHIYCKTDSTVTL